MSDRDGYSSGQMLVAFLGGAAVGAAVAYLTAPRSGEETRTLIAEGIKTRGEKLSRKPRAMKAAYAAAAAAAREAYNEAYQAELKEAEEE